MLSVRSAISLSMGVSVSLLAAACGGSSSSTFDDAARAGGQAQGAGDAPGSFVQGETGPTGTHDACVSSVASASLQPVNLIMMFDKSGSMGDVNNKPTPYDPNLKWNPVTTGMKAFFSDPGSVTLNASLQFFPLGDDIAGVCGYPYATPKVALTPLSTPAPFVDAIASTSPNGGTPTLPALRGAIDYAKQTAAKRPSEKTVVVLVTDGEPGMIVNGTFAEGCTDNDTAHVATAAAEALAGSPSIPTYVIGVGPSLDKLNAVAAAGGTKAAMMVSVDDPTKTKGIFQDTLNAIRSQTMSCEFAVPPPPDGKQIDTTAVNVVYTGSSSGEQVLTYSEDCAVAGGWHYDNPAAPTKIELCAASCSTAQKDRGGKLTLAFGCLTKTVVK